MPASSWVDVINDAAIELGAGRVFSLSDTTKQARLGVERYPYAVECVLQMKPWKSVAKRAELAQLVQQPAFGITYYYQLPTDYIRMIATHPDMDFHKIEGRTLLTNSTKAQIIYVANPTTPVYLSPLLSKSISLFLAWTIGYSVTQKPEMVKTMEEKFQRIYRQAKSAEAFEDSSLAWEAVEMLTARLGPVGYDGVGTLYSQTNF